MGTNFEERREYFDTLRLIYQDASSVIHAGKAKHIAKDRGLLDRGRELCRQAIRMTLEHGRPDWRDVVLGKT
ncbi:MAG: hypothetical protein OXH15_08250 [Gammaproteobacteria bacterium]|nr:hypothetical protein [Gammaproteobacteria bacterium]